MKKEEIIKEIRKRVGTYRTQDVIMKHSMDVMKEHYSSLSTPSNSLTETTKAVKAFGEAAKRITSIKSPPPPKVSEGDIGYVKQEQKYGCGFSCIAMILNTDYWTVKNEFPKTRLDKELGAESGISVDFDAKSYLYQKGYIGYTVYETLGYLQKKREPKEWIKEFAPLHIISVVLNGHSHACVWKDGIIYDPFREGEYTIDDYEKIESITGFWKLALPQEKEQTEGETE